MTREVRAMGRAVLARQTISSKIAEHRFEAQRSGPEEVVEGDAVARDDATFREIPQPVQSTRGDALGP